MDKLIRELQEIKIIEKLELREGNRTYIRNSLNQVIAQIDDAGDEIILYSVMGAILGKYSKSSDMTTYSNGALVGYGNLLGTLISN
jgi:ribosomal protein L18